MLDENKMSTNLVQRSRDAIRVIKSQAYALRELKKVDPKSRYVLVYPDSDNVYVGMGFKLLNSPAEDVYARASELSKKNLLQLCLDGPKSDLLDSFENQQLAAFTTSHATMVKFAHDNPEGIDCCKAAGGIGVGFVNSLVFSEAMTFEDGLDLVQRRAQAMERAAQIVPNAKLRIKLMPATSKFKVCQAAIEECIKRGIPEEIAVCSVTKSISPQVIEVAGHEEAIRYLEEEGTHLFDFRAMRRIVKNPHAFNSKLMQPASDFIRGYIKQRLTENPDYIKDPQKASVYSATSGERLRQVDYITEDLYRHPVKSIKIEQLLNCLFMRPHKLSQPNILVMWDKSLMRTLSVLNRKARVSAKLLAA